MMTHCLAMVSYSPNSVTVRRQISSNRALTSTKPTLSISLRPSTSGPPPGPLCSCPMESTKRVKNPRRDTAAFPDDSAALPAMLLMGLVGLLSRELAFSVSLSTRSSSSMTACGLQNSVLFIWPSSRTTLGASSEEKPMTSTGPVEGPGVSKLNSDFSSMGGRGMSEGRRARVVRAMP
ncbi:predicted protein [Plenodomus lingam JN3]|uniref:Predicted protein n=1 Tax=Leptosphaeria maculans (strain JN3 / isolate v23.1.3 / race Av1-4-5-6-7-8) TaxID=985895 RepID=E5ACQ5_LEPMJ|nr:predicted protein [Plenodomus lingam JN3]CBY02257.1 predicted protein [Plenodomus lingam JN3]